jgi:predicted nucleic acid-binding protein
MPLDLPAGATVFLDSTIIHYAFVDFPGATAQCIGLLNRVASREVTSCLTVPVLNDAVHKVMCSEAKVRFAQPRAGLVNWMKANPHRVRELGNAAEVLGLTAAMPVRLLDVGLTTLAEAQAISHAHGLLAGDALIVAAMRQHGVVHLATNDDDFDAIPGLTIWKPR